MTKSIYIVICDYVLEHNTGFSKILFGLINNFCIWFLSSICNRVLVCRNTWTKLSASDAELYSLPQYLGCPWHRPGGVKSLWQDQWACEALRTPSLSFIILLLLNIKDTGQGLLLALCLITSNKIQLIMTWETVVGYQTSGQNFSEAVPKPPSLLWNMPS